MDQLYLHFFFLFFLHVRSQTSIFPRELDASAVFSFVSFLFPAVLIHLNLLACFGGTLSLLR